MWDNDRKIVLLEDAPPELVKPKNQCDAVVKLYGYAYLTLYSVLCLNIFHSLSEEGTFSLFFG